MIEEFLQRERELERAKIISETAKMPWLELQRFFAAGNVMLVATELDLVDVAYALQLDNIEQVKTWTESSQVCAVDDDQAKLWISSDALLWAVVVKPWVLVQTIPDS
jgi:hypothetical protein